MQYLASSLLKASLDSTGSPFLIQLNPFLLFSGGNWGGGGEASMSGLMTSTLALKHSIECMDSDMQLQKERE